MISKQSIDQVFETARVEEVIGDFVQLKKSGANFKGLSPFSDERTPSFMVSPAKQIWKDFSTGKGGNVVTFLMEHEHFTYPEAIKWLAQKYQVEIDETLPSEKEKKALDKRESMYALNKYAAAYFVQMMNENEVGRAIGLSYFKERGFSPQTIDKFELGYCLDEWDAFTQKALKDGFDIEILQETGLTIRKDNNKSFDRFKGRVMFPIQSMSGRVLGFGGRTLKKDKNTAKYLNSPESEVYHKSKVLYGLYQAKQAIAKEDNCYLVEGYTDVISLYQVGVQNVVASSGTALTGDQIRMIKRLTPNITVLYDGDAAGIRASIRGIDMLLEEGMNVRVVLFPEGEDPDSFARKNTHADFIQFLKDNQSDFIHFKVTLLLEEAKDDPIKKAKLIRSIVESIAKIPDAIQREVYVQTCAQLLELSEEILYNELAQLMGKKVVNTAASKKEMKALKPTEKNDVNKAAEKPLEFYEKEIIKILLIYGGFEADFVDYTEVYNDKGNLEFVKEEYKNNVAREIYMQLQEDEIAFSKNDFQKVYIEIANYLQQDIPLNIEQLTQHQDSQITQLVTDILMGEDKFVLSNWKRRDIYVKPKEEGLSKWVTDTLLNFRRELIRLKINELSDQVKHQKENNETLEMVMNYTYLKSKIFQKLNRIV